MRLAYQYRLKPNRTQEKSLGTLLTVACRLYKAALAERKNAWEQERRTVTYLEQAEKLKALRETDKEVALLNCSAAQHVLRRLDKAFRRFFKAIQSGQKVGYPRFKKPHRFRTLEFTYGDGTKIKPDEKGRLRLYIQNVGLVRVIWHRPLPEHALIKQVWVTRKADGWYVAFALEVPDGLLRQPLPPTGRAVGGDVGVENLLALSDAGLSSFLSLGSSWVEGLAEVAPCRRACSLFWPGFRTPGAGTAAAIPSRLCWQPSSWPP